MILLKQTLLNTKLLAFAIFNIFKLYITGNSTEYKEIGHWNA